MLEHMFDSMPPRFGTLRELSDAALVTCIGDWARIANSAEACKTAAIAELVRRRVVDEHPDWACDDWDACAAELSCALTIGHGPASGQMTMAIALRDRLPKVGALFLAGEVGARTAGTITWRTMLVDDGEALAAIDTDIAEAVRRWGALSKYKLEKAIDAAVERHDPDAVRRARSAMRGRNFTIGDHNDETGTTSVWGKLSTPDAALLHQAIQSLIRSVCDEDPRTMAQRRADAVGALAARATRLPCRCDNPGCPATAAGADPVATQFVIQVLADESALAAVPDPQMDGGPDLEDQEPTAPTEHQPPTRTAALRPVPAGLIPDMPGSGLVPAAVVADLIVRGAKVRPIDVPDSAPEPRYRPSAKTDRYVRTRDLTCRHPGCDRTAVHTDIDHTIPHPYGPTHPSNSSCRCRKHHLVKTFWPGWTDEQHPDGTIVTTTPAGHRYTTKPGVALLFPGTDTTTAALPPPAGRPWPTPARGLKMPKRKQTRAKARAYRMKAERARNTLPSGDPPC